MRHIALATDDADSASPRRAPALGTRHASAAAKPGGGSGPLKLAAAGAAGAIIYFNNESIRGSSLYWSLADAGANLLRKASATPRTRIQTRCSF